MQRTLCMSEQMKAVWLHSVALSKQQTNRCTSLAIQCLLPQPKCEKHGIVHKTSSLMLKRHFTVYSCILFHPTLALQILWVLPACTLLSIAGYRTCKYFTSCPSKHELQMPHLMWALKVHLFIWKVPKQPDKNSYQYVPCYMAQTSRK